MEPTPAVEQKPIPQLFARLTLVEKMYHADPTGDILPIESTFTRYLHSEEQPYVRRTRIKSDWTKLDHGWLKRCSYVLISNDVGRTNQVILSPEEKALQEAKVLEVGVKIAAEYENAISIMRIPPGESVRFSPTELENLYLRYVEGEGRCTISVLPT